MTDEEKTAIAIAQLAHLLKISTEEAAVLVFCFRFAMAFGRR